MGEIDGLNIYCDESTHLEHDHMPFLVLGGTSCARSRSREANQRIRDIKVKHGFPESFEVKWTKVSAGKVDFYEEVIDYFFDNADLSFRVVVAPKAQLDHARFEQSHDEWYYKMMFYLLRNLLVPETPAFIYLDRKDTRSSEKIERLHSVLANSQYDFDRQIIRRVQAIESHHVNLMQVSDLLAGAVNYANRGLSTNPAKVRLVSRIRTRSRASLTQSTLPHQRKFNVFHWMAR